MKLSSTNKTIILTIVCTLAVALFFGAIVYAFSDEIGIGRMDRRQMQEDRDDQMEDDQRGPKDNQDNSRRDNGPDSDKNFGFKDRSDSRSGRDDFDKDSIGEIKSIDGTNIVITVKSPSKDRDSDDQSEDKTYTVASGVDLTSLAVGDTVKYEVDDNNQITSIEKFELKDRSQDQNNRNTDNSDNQPNQDNRQSRNSDNQQDQKQTSFSTSV